MAYFNAVYQSDLSHRARAVYMYLKDRSDAEGQCWPAIKTIGAELGLSRSTVKVKLHCVRERMIIDSDDFLPLEEFCAMPSERCKEQGMCCQVR